LIAVDDIDVIGMKPKEGFFLFLNEMFDLLCDVENDFMNGKGMKQGCLGNVLMKRNEAVMTEKLEFLELRVDNWIAEMGGGF
jgi:hypothetical protein